MNSSGIKRGLAVSAISALAIAGIPALATSASAAPGDIIQVQSTVDERKARNGGTEGGLIILNTQGVLPGQLKLAGTNLTVGAGGEDNATQSVDIVGTPTLIASGAVGDLTPNNGLDQISLRVAVTTPPGGDDIADFVIFEDEPVANNAVDLTEPRVQTSVETTGAVTAVDITPATQSAPANEPSGAYTVTIRDSEGDLTQLTGGETVALTGTGGVTFNPDATITAAEINDGTADFTAQAATTGTKTITATQGTVTDTATLNVTAAATLTLADIDVVTGADSGPAANGDATDPTFVRVDQSSVRFDIDSDDPADANSTVTFTVTSEGGNGVTFGGEASRQFTTTLDGNGVGSITVTPDAGTIQEGDGFSVTGVGISDLDIIFQRAAITAGSLDAPPLVFTQVDTPASVTVTVTDQFGNPVSGAQVSADIAGNGVGADPASDRPRQTTNASGQTTFTFPAGDTQVGDVDNVTFTLFDDAADASGTTATDMTQIRYTADGQGPNYQITLDGQNTEAPAYSPDDVSVDPLTDAVADNSDFGDDEFVNLTIVNGEAGVPVTVTVDNGALILTGTDTSLEDGVSSVTGVVGNTFKIIGTKSGIVTVTTTSAGRTETAQFTVAAQDDQSTARNVTVSGPATVPAGTTQIQYTAVITDAFGNPVQGVTVGQLNVQVTGPAQFQDSDAVSNAAGQIKLNVRVDAGAAGTVTIRVQGVPGFNQFGAQADRETSFSNTDDAEGLPASSNVATASTTVAAAPVATFGPDGATLTGNPETSAEVGTAVTETFTAKDSDGNPLAGVTVTFTRTGAGGVEQTNRTTNANGVATYVFTSAAPGETTITAEATALGSTVTKTDTVTFTPAPVVVPDGPTKINVNTFVGNENGGRTDRVRINVTGDNAPIGATATLFKRVNGRNVKLKVKTLSSRAATFRVRDLNKRQLTLYFVKVSKTAKTQGKTGPVKKVR